MEPIPTNSAVLQTSRRRKLSDDASIDHLRRQYGNINVDGPGLTIIGNVYNNGTLFQARPQAKDVVKFGLCLGSAPQIDPASFVGRAIELEKMSQYLQPGTVGGKQRRIILGGIGGVGKTQLALVYAERYQQSYDSVFWLNATSQLTISADLRLLAGRLLSAQELEVLNEGQILNRVHEWLSDSRNQRWLLIFDNYDEPTQFDIDKCCPYTAHGSVIITTRLPDYVRLSSDQLRIQPLSDIEESLDILQKRSGRQEVKEDPSAHRLAIRMSGLPLALATAGAYLSKRPSLTFQQYLDVYEKRWNIESRRPLQLQEYRDRTLYTTWNVSYARLKDDHPEAALMLKALAYFDNQDIWYECLHAGVAEDSPSWLQEMLADRIKFGNVMSTLVEYCFCDVQPVTQSYSMHNCVHDWTLGTLNQPLDQQLYRYSFSCIAANINDDDWDSRSLGHLKYARLTQHALRLVHPLFSEDPAQFDITAEWANEICYAGCLLTEQAQLVAAEKIYLRARTWSKRALGPDYLSTIYVNEGLAHLYYRQGKLKDAEQMFQEVVASIEKAYGPGHFLTLNTFNSLGLLYSDQDSLEEAEQMYQRALVGREQALGPEHISTLETVYNFGILYYKQDKPKKAERMYQRALAGYEKAFGPDHQSTLRAVESLGILYNGQGKYEEAEKQYLRALAGKEKVFGPEHALTIRTKLNLAESYSFQGKLDQAESMYLQLLGNHHPKLGHDVTLTMRLLCNFALLRETQGQSKEAEEMYRQILADYQKQVGLEHPLMRKTMRSLIRLCQTRGKTEKEAQAYIRELTQQTS